MMDGYRDNLEALRARSRELDGELALVRGRKRPEGPVFTLEGLGQGLLALALLALTGTLLLTSFGAWRWTHRRDAILQHIGLSPPPPTTARSFSAYGPQGQACKVELIPPCRALIRCGGGRPIYSGAGSCSADGFVDRADNTLDGTPQCEIDLLHRRVWMRDADSDGERFRIELEIDQP